MCFFGALVLRLMTDMCQTQIATHKDTRSLSYSPSDVEPNARSMAKRLIDANLRVTSFTAFWS